MRGRGMGAVVVVAAIAVLVVACSARVGLPSQAATATTAAGATTTSGPASVSTVVGRTPEQIKDALTTAVAARSFCAFTAALDNAVPDVTDGQSVITTYQELASAVRDAKAFRPAELADAWDVVIDAVDEGVTVAERVGGDLNDPALRAPFTAGDFDAAMSEVESWSDTNCSSE